MYTVGDIAAWAHGRVVGDTTHTIVGIADLVRAGPQDVSFLTHARYRAQYAQTRAGCVLVQRAHGPADAPHAGCALIFCDDPYLALAHVAAKMFAAPNVQPTQHAGACIDPQARVDATAHVGAGAVVEADAHIGAGAHIGPQAFVGRGAVIGAGSHLHAGARVLSGCRIGARVILHAGCIIGSDGFGFATDARTGMHHKIPQMGTVELGDDVEVGANSTIDRATFGSTRIGAGTKIDNLVQIGHNVVLGSHCIVVSQSGIAGSTTLGDNVIVGAQGGINGHLAIASNVMLAARAGVVRDIETAGIYSGVFDVSPHHHALKISIAQAKLPELRRRVRQLEQQMDALAPQPEAP